MGIYEKIKRGELMCLFMSMLYDKIKSEFFDTNNNGLLLDVTWEHIRKIKERGRGRGHY
jgi:hypothetical protein